MQPARIPISGKNGKNKYALVDVEDVAKVAGIRWHLSDRGYVVNRSTVNGVKTTIRMHRVIMEPEAGKDVDHLNGVRTDNRRENLSICTRAENLLNKRAKGCWYDKRRGTWQIDMSIDKKKYYFGAYRDEDEAMSIAACIRHQLIEARIGRG